ncbi:MAG: YidC/Oxa1 family membrane protein insertase [Lachnospiraceae bacterium]|nr:YidC/Oxa1 family membrane protein insertase [Ruminococcus sp.]MCM1274474.1 YidC/Oxa1 family membrane protein insertase [Lachnospiraceae bacterium]
MDVIQFLYSLIGTPLGYILYFIYKFICSNVGIAIIIFTFIVKIAMLPLSIKQQKNSAKSAVFQPKVAEIQQKYRNNQQKMQEELAKLQAQGYKPMSGCGSMLLSFLILFGVIDVVYKPLTHIVHMNGDSINAVVEESYNVELTSVIVNEYVKPAEDIEKLNEKERIKHEDILRDSAKFVDYYNAHCLKDGESAVDVTVFNTLDDKTVKVVEGIIKAAISEAYSQDKSNVQLANTDIYKITDEERAALDAMSSEEEKTAYRAAQGFSNNFVTVLNNVQAHYGAYKATGDDVVAFQATTNMQRELYALNCFGTETENYSCKNAYSEAAVRPEVREELEELYGNLNFIGIKLGVVPKDEMRFPMILVPIISFLMALLQTFVSNRMMAKSNPDAAASMGSMKVMMYVMPLMSLWIAFTVPAGAGFYWTISYAFGILQTILLNKLYDPAKLKEQALAEFEEKNKRSKTVNVDAVKVVNEDGKEETLSQKEINRRKLAAARKADAEKYGEEYHEDDDD